MPDYRKHCSVRKCNHNLGSSRREGDEHTRSENEEEKESVNKHEGVHFKYIVYIVKKIDLAKSAI